MLLESNLGFAQLEEMVQATGRTQVGEQLEEVVQAMGWTQVGEHCCSLSNAVQAGSGHMNHVTLLMWLLRQCAVNQDKVALHL